MRNAYILVENSERRRPLGRPGLRLEDNIKTSLTKVNVDVD